MFAAVGWRCGVSAKCQNGSRRFLSSTPRSYPQYTVYGPGCKLSLKLIFPTFRLRRNVLVLDSSKRGKLLLEWVSRKADGSISPDNLIRFALAPEEVGFLIDQLPDHPVEFSRQGVGEVGFGGGSIADDRPDKVFRATPVEGGGVSFKLDFELNGVGGQTSSGLAGPWEVVGQRGEFVVMRELLRSTIPVLTGWSTMVDTGLKHSIEASGEESSKDGGDRAP